MINFDVGMGPEQGISNLNAMLAALSFWQPNTAIGLGAIARSHSVITNGTFYAECITAGTTGVSEPAWPAVGQTVTDGTVTWIIRDKSQATNFAQQPDLSAIATKIPTVGYINDWMQSIKNSDQTIWDGNNWSYPPLGAHGLSDSNGYVVIDKLGHLCLQWRRYTADIQPNSFNTLTLPIPFTKIFAAILSDTDADGGVTGDFSGGAAIKAMGNNTIAWNNNWNIKQSMLINVLTIGIV